MGQICPNQHQFKIINFARMIANYPFVTLAFPDKIYVHFRMIMVGKIKRFFDPVKNQKLSSPDKGGDFPKNIFHITHSKNDD